MSSSYNMDRPSTSKRTVAGTYKSQEQQLLEWLNEDSELDFSDVDDGGDDPNFEPETVELDEDEISFEESTTTSASHQDTGSTNYTGKNGYVWSDNEGQRSTRTPARNIIRLPMRLNATQFEGYVELWNKLFDPIMLNTLVQHTNQKLSVYRRQFKNSDRVELKDTDEVETKALIGLLYYSSAFKCNNADLDIIFASDGTGHEIFRCVMSQYRFKCLINCLRFDDITRRAENLKSDPLAPISSVFDKFILNCQAQYSPGANMCIDEMLLPFKGRCKFIVYLPQKPAKYGIKIMIICDAKTFYIYNAYIYYGKNSDGLGMTEAEKEMSVPAQSVLRLCKPIEGSNRNITADNWFSSIPLVELLLKRNMTYLGTVRKNKAEIPPSFLPNKDRPAESSMYGFTKDMTLLSYVPKKNKAVILISSSHRIKEDDTESGKPMMIADYNHTKGGVDEIDKKMLHLFL